VVVVHEWWPSVTAPPATAAAMTHRRSGRLRVSAPTRQLLSAPNGSPALSQTSQVSKKSRRSWVHVESDAGEALTPPASPPRPMGGVFKTIGRMLSFGRLQTTGQQDTDVANTDDLNAWDEL